MRKLIEIDSLTIDDMRRLARERGACSPELEWLDAPDRTTAEVIERLKGEWSYAYWVVARLAGTVNLLPLQDAVIAARDGGAMYRYADNVPGADLERLQDAVIASRNPWAIKYYAQDIPGADIERLQDAVIECGEAQSMHSYARDIPGADKARLRAAIDKLENASCLT